ncbi:MAG: hypothetical protein Q4F97_09785 [Bacteroidales bacterium]|nr:hypothetical protein [Bacteroidales bacterium]
MKKQYIYIFALCACISNTVDGNAQSAKDSTLNRELLLEKEYNPIVRDANKINKLPAVEAPKANKTKIVYSDYSTFASSKNQINNLQAGSIMSDYEFSKKFGYITLGGGNLLNLTGNLGIKMLNNDNNVLGIEVSHNSTNGNVDYTDNIKSLSRTDDTKLKINDNLVNLFYKGYFNSFNLSTNLSYQYNRFNYYGWRESFLEIAPPALMEDPAMQTNQRINFDIAANTSVNSPIKYEGNLGFSMFKMDEPGINELTVNLGGGFSTRLNSENWRFGFKAGMKGVLYSGDYYNIDSFENIGKVELLPSFIYDNEDYVKAELGVKADYAFGVGPHIGIAPDVNFDWQFVDNFFLYSTIKGGIDVKTINNITNFCRYYNQYGNLNKNPYTLADWTLGFRSNAVNGFWFDIYGGLSHTLNEFSFQSMIESQYDSSKGIIAGKNYLSSFSEDVTKYKIGTLLKYDYGSTLGLSLKLQKNGWSTESKEALSYAPGFEAVFNAVLRPIKQLVFNVNYNMFAQRKARIGIHRSESSNSSDPSIEIVDEFKYSIVDLDNVNDLSIKASWLFNNTFSIYASMNNLAISKYDIWYGMPNQGFNFLVGGTIQF